MKSYSIVTASVEETEKAGYEVAKLAEDTGFIALYGDLGAGKTAFVRGAAKYLAPGASVSSPTYSIVNEYSPSCGQPNAPAALFHFDMYRITDPEDLESIDFDSYFLRGGTIITEWSENIEFALPDEYIKVVIKKDGGEKRIITVSKVVKK